MSLLLATLSMPVKTRLMEEQARTTSSMAWRQSPTLAVSGGRWYSGHSKTAHTRWRHTTQPVRITSQGWIQRSLDTEMKKPGGEQSKLCITRWLEVMDVIKKSVDKFEGSFMSRIQCSIMRWKDNENPCARLDETVKATFPAGNVQPLRCFLSLKKTAASPWRCQ